MTSGWIGFGEKATWKSTTEAKEVVMINTNQNRTGAETTATGEEAEEEAWEEGRITCRNEILYET